MLNPPPTPLQKYHRRLPNLHNRDEMASAALVSIVTAHICLASPCIFPSFHRSLWNRGFLKYQFRRSACTASFERSPRPVQVTHGPHWTTEHFPSIRCVTMRWVLPCCRCPLKGGKVFHSFHVARGAFGACVPLRSMWL